MAKRVVVLGGGESGSGAAVLAKVKNFDVFLSDLSTLNDEYRKRLEDYDIPYEEGRHSKDLIYNADLIIKSPGIPDNVPIIREIVALGIPVISEIEFAGKFDTSKKICITGSNGKTTTTSIIYYLLKNAGLNVGLGGNIGKSYAYQIATEEIFDIFVLELSSFQLDGMYDFKADIAILLNITPDHLDRYDDNMKNYIRSKFRITQNMSEDDFFIFCADDDMSIGHLNEIILRARMLPMSQTKEIKEGAYKSGDKMIVRYNNDSYEMYITELALQGKHNLYNSMAAAIAGKVMNITNEIIRDSLRSFQGVEHRLEKVLSIRSVLYINDSKATNVNSTWYALESMDRPVVWIAGGTDKGNDYEVLNELVKNKVKALICLGVDNTKLHRSFDHIIETVVDVDSMQRAVEKAYELASPGDVVLLSPANASFDRFKNYEDRGIQFKKAVKQL